MLFRILSYLMVAGASLVLASCSNNSPREQDTTTPPVQTVAAVNPTLLEHGEASMEALIQKALHAFAKRDTATLRDLLITHEEFNTILYPEYGIHYPAAQDTRPEVRQFIWDNQQMGTVKGLSKALAAVGGKETTAKGVHFTDGTKEFPSFTLHEGTVVRVALNNGKEADLLALGSIIEKDGMYKLLSYRDIKD